MSKYTHVLLLTFLWLSVTIAAHADDDLMPVLQQLQRDWAITKYETVKDQRVDDFEKLAVKASMLAKQFPDRAEPLVWQAIITSTEAGEAGGLSALKLVKQARELLITAEKINPDVLQGSIYTSLGSLYYQVPGWPVGFGNDDKAEEYLKRALSINPEGIDPNYFYADYLFSKKRYSEALIYIDRALKAPVRQNRSIADKGRQGEARELKQKIQLKLAYHNDSRMVRIV